jgi:hypothetical protein
MSAQLGDRLHAQRGKLGRRLVALPGVIRREPGHSFVHLAAQIVLGGEEDEDQDSPAAHALLYAGRSAGLRSSAAT